MKLNKWTLGLAALGAVSLASVAQAEEKVLLDTKAELTSTTISGYVNTSAAWDFGKNASRANTRGYAFSQGKGDGFNLDVVDVALEKALDESEWAAGYKAEFWFGPDVNLLGTKNLLDTGGAAIKQAYVSLRTPVGNGIDWKVGVFDTITGYEATNAGDNPNYSRSWGYSIGARQHTGILASYRFTENISASAGIADTWDSVINNRVANVSTGSTQDSVKTYMASIALTAPESFGFLEGGTLYGGVVSGKIGSAPGSSARTSWYVGVTVPTPWESLKAGAAFDYVHIDNRLGNSNGDSSALALYVSHATTEKLTLHGRLDYIRVGGDGLPAGGGILGAAYAPTTEILSTTVTADYQLWRNVISRAELRWDHDLDSRALRTATTDDEFTLLANIIYKF